MIHFKRFAPFANRVLVKKAEPLTKSKGGVILTDSSKAEVNHGIVV